MGRKVDKRVRQSLIEALRQHRRYRMLQDRICRLVESGCVAEHLNDLLKPLARRRDQLFRVNGRRVPYSLSLAYHLAEIFPDTQANVYVGNESEESPVLVQRAWVEALNEPVPSSPGEADPAMEMITSQPTYTWLRQQDQSAALPLQGQLSGFTQKGLDFYVQGHDDLQAQNQLVTAQDDLISSPAAAGLSSPAWETQASSLSASVSMECVSNAGVSDDSSDSDVAAPLGLRKKKRSPVVRDNSQESKAKRRLTF